MWKHKTQGHKSDNCFPFQKGASCAVQHRTGGCSGGLKAEADTETGQEPPGRRPFRDPWRIRGHGRRHGTITGFQVYRGLEKSRFQKHKHFSLYHPCGMLSFFSVIKDRKCRTPSAVCSGERTSHTAHPSPVGVRLRVVSQ